MHLGYCGHAVYIDHLLQILRLHRAFVGLLHNLMQILTIRDPEFAGAADGCVSAYFWSLLLVVIQMGINLDILCHL